MKARQKSESRDKPKSRRKSVLTRPGETGGGGKATPVNEQMGQLKLPFETAEELPMVKTSGADGGPVLPSGKTGTHAVPKSDGKEESSPSAMMDQAIIASIQLLIGPKSVRS